MLITHSREKLLNAILFFLENTKSCHKTKLFKLLFFLDFRIYRETGRSVTGLQYAAWPMGPVPEKLNEELKDPGRDFSDHFLLRYGTSKDFDFAENVLVMKGQRKFDQSWFTERELTVMKEVAEVYETATAKEMSEISHLPGAPWHRVYEIEKRKQAVIPYTLALDDKAGSLTKDQTDSLESDFRVFKKIFG